MVIATAVRPSSGHAGIVSARARLPERSDRPAWIRLLAVVAVIAAFATALTVALGAGTARTGIDELGQRTAPGVAATEDLASALADMDSQIANLLLAGSDSSLSSTRTSAVQIYEQRRAQADNDLRQATVIGGGDATAQRTISSLLDQLGRYEALAADIELLDGSQNNPAGRPSAEILAQYRQATDLMAGMQRATQDLTHTNSGVLDTAYTATQHDVSMSDAALAVCALVLLGALVALQIMLRLAMRRRINPALVVATMLALVLVVGGAVTNVQAAHQLRIAKRDAFGSLLALEQARAIGFDANADESRYLLDPGRAARYEQAFLTKSQQLAAVDVNTLDQYYSALAAAVAAMDAGGQAGIGGLYGQELHNITFPGEADAARATVDAYRTYQKDDATLRTRAQTDLRTAISFDTSPATGTSDGDFAAYNAHVDSVIAINERAFAAAIASGTDALSGWTDPIPYTLLALTAVAVFLGVRPRLAEYR